MGQFSNDKTLPQIQKHMFFFQTIFLITCIHITITTIDQIIKMYWFNIKTEVDRPLKVSRMPKNTNGVRDAEASPWWLAQKQLLLCTCMFRLVRHVLHFHPYKMAIVQQLTSNNYALLESKFRG